MRKKFLAVLPSLIVILTAVAFGVIEGRAVNHHMDFGPPNLFGLFIWDYHGMMLILMLAICLGWGRWPMVWLWALVEDMVYWVITGQALTAGSWVSFHLGGFMTPLGYLPWVYFILIGLWLICEFLNAILNHTFNIPSLEE